MRAARLRLVPELAACERCSRPVHQPASWETTSRWCGMHINNARRDLRIYGLPRTEANIVEQLRNPARARGLCPEQPGRAARAELRAVLAQHGVLAGEDWPALLEAVAHQLRVRDALLEIVAEAALEETDT